MPNTNPFIVFIKYYNSHILISDNICMWTCIMNFWLGMLFITYREVLMTRRNAAISAAILALFSFVRLPLPSILCMTVMGACLYIILTTASPFILKAAPLKAAIGFISRYSYGVFLVHHVLIYGVMFLMKETTFSRAGSFAFFIPVFLLILLTSVLLTETVNFLMRLFDRCIASLFGQAAQPNP